MQVFDGIMSGDVGFTCNQVYDVTTHINSYHRLDDWSLMFDWDDLERRLATGSHTLPSYDQQSGNEFRPNTSFGFNDNNGFLFGYEPGLQAVGSLPMHSGHSPSHLLPHFNQPMNNQPMNNQPMNPPALTNVSMQPTASMQPTESTAVTLLVLLVFIYD